MAEVVQGTAALQRRLSAVSGIDMGEKMMKRMATMSIIEAKHLVHRKTGNLARSINYKGLSPTHVTIYAGARYAPFVEFGTRGGQIILPKPGRSKINPKHAHSLAWGGPRRLSGSLRSGGKPTAFAMRVVRGATRPYPFLVPAVKMAVQKSGLKDAIIEEWNGAA